MKIDTPIKLPSFAGEAPSGYNQGQLVLRKPQNPLKGRGHERLHWRLDGIIILGENESKKIESGLQRWFLNLLNADHRVHMDQCNWVTSEAWQTFVNHESFWRNEWQRCAEDTQAKKSETLKADRSKIRNLKKDQAARRSQLAEKAGISPQEITAKCDRLQSLIQSGHQSLAGQLIQAAEPWLLQTILDGCRTSESTFHLNRFFEKTPDDTADYLFLLTASRAQKLGCCPKSIVFQTINNIELSAKTSTDLQFILEDILTSLPKLQQLILNLGDFHASTDSFPQLPNLTRLQICGNEGFKTKLTITNLDCFPSLALLSVERLGNFSVCEGLDDVWNRVRLETGGHSDSFLESGLFSLREPPVAVFDSIWNGCRSMNDHALNAFLYMQRDWSSFEDPPIWWHSHWTAPHVRSQVAGKILDFNWPNEEVSSTSFSTVIEDCRGVLHPHPCPLGHKNTVGITDRVSFNQIIAESQGRSIDLIGWTSLPVNQARLIARANVSVRMNSNLLSRDVICAFGDFAGDLEVHGRISDELLGELMHIAFSKLEIEFESFGPETFQILEKFRGRCIAIRLGKPLKATDCQSLSRCTGDLVLKSFDRPTVTHLDAKAAAALSHRSGRLHLDRSLHLTEEAIHRLAEHPGVELANHRQILKRKNKDGETLVTILRFYDPLPHKKEVHA